MSHKILVVEDDAATAAYVAKGMGEAGFTVDRADNGRDGLFLASAGSYGAITLDRLMPAMDGMAMLKALSAAAIERPELGRGPSRERGGAYVCITGVGGPVK